MAATFVPTDLFLRRKRINIVEDNLNIQPLDALMIRLNLTNADLIKNSKSQLTFKMLQKGRKGKQLTANAKHKILEALQACKLEEQFTLKDLFNY